MAEEGKRGVGSLLPELEEESDMPAGENMLLARRV